MYSVHTYSHPVEILILCEHPPQHRLLKLHIKLDAKYIVCTYISPNKCIDSGAVVPDLVLLLFVVLVLQSSSRVNSSKYGVNNPSHASYIRKVHHYCCCVEYRIYSGLYNMYSALYTWYKKYEVQQTLVISYLRGYGILLHDCDCLLLLLFVVVVCVDTPHHGEKDMQMARAATYNSQEQASSKMTRATTHSCLDNRYKSNNIRNKLTKIHESCMLYIDEAEFLTCDV